MFVFMKKMPNLSQMIGFYNTATIRTKELRDRLKGDLKDKSELLYFHALENNWLFQTVLKKTFKKCKFAKYFGNMKENLLRIQQKIVEYH